MLRSTKLQCFCLILLLVFLPDTLMAQDGKPNLTLKLYSYFTYSESASEEGVNPFDIEKKLGVGHFAPALQIWTHNGNFQEIEVSSIGFNSTLFLSQNRGQENEVIETYAGEISNDYHLSLKYEYNYSILKKSKKYHPYIGASAQPEIGYLRTTPLVSNRYKTDVFKASVWIQIVPRLIVDLSDKFILDINLPIPLTSMYWSVLNVDNPNMSEEDRKTSSVGIDLSGFRDNFQFRIGIGLKL